MKSKKIWIFLSHKSKPQFYAMVGFFSEYVELQAGYIIALQGCVKFMLIVSPMNVCFMWYRFHGKMDRIFGHKWEHFKNLSVHCMEYCRITDLCRARTWRDQRGPPEQPPWEGWSIPAQCQPQPQSGTWPPPGSLHSRPTLGLSPGSPPSGHWCLHLSSHTGRHI